MKKLFIYINLAFIALTNNLNAEDGYNLWLRYTSITDTQLLEHYKINTTNILVLGKSKTIAVAKNELQSGMEGLLGSSVIFTNTLVRNGTILIADLKELSAYKDLKLKTNINDIGKEGYIIESTTIAGKKCIVIAGNNDIGVLYGVYGFISLLQTHANISNLSISEAPRLQIRLLNHWDNLNRTVERGYAGSSLWDWHKLPDYIYPQYTDYARANASIGINGTVLNNVNANAQILTPEYLQKVAALANVFRPYGIKVYLTARFSAPVEIAGLKTADPLDSSVIYWWKKKADEIYSMIPDFGGFLVKANSEGQPGPQNYGRNHVDGANMMARALAPHGGIVMWRAFVYSHDAPDDRAKQAYNEFKPMDGKFLPNVFVQVKNGAIDFQPREPFHPLFGAMPQTPLMMEFQITKEYLGFSTHLAYLAPLYKEVLNSDTYTNGKGSEVAKIIDGSLDKHALSGMAGVSNIGADRNWCGSHFDQANWFAYGRLAWNHSLTSEAIADQWIKMTFSNDKNIIDPIKEMMMVSREAAVNYMTPLGLHHLMGWGHHYGPEPWLSSAERPDWNSVFYHKADSVGIGFNRSSTGSKATLQYTKPISDIFDNKNTCPENVLLWFHHVNWDYKMKSGNTLWNELCYKYYSGVDTVSVMLNKWNNIEGKIDNERFHEVKTFLQIQQKEAIWWRNACVLYFQTFSKRPIPPNLEIPDESLEYYMYKKTKYAPGI